MLRWGVFCDGLTVGLGLKIKAFMSSLLGSSGISPQQQFCLLCIEVSGTRDVLARGSVLINGILILKVLYSSVKYCLTCSQTFRGDRTRITERTLKLLPVSCSKLLRNRAEIDIGVLPRA